jgi:hypothetical protein
VPTPRARNHWQKTFTQSVPEEKFFSHCEQGRWRAIVVFLEVKKKFRINGGTKWLENQIS